jgi:hypothetical protein
VWVEVIEDDDEDSKIAKAVEEAGIIRPTALFVLFSLYQTFFSPS